MTTPKSILIIVTSTHEIAAGEKTGLWLEEFAVPFELFTRQNYRITVASSTGGKAPIDPRSVAQDQPQTEWAQACQALENTIAFSAVQSDDFDAVFIPGGHGTMFDFPDDRQLHTILRTFAEQDKVIAAMCHGPAGLVGVTLSDGSPLVAGKSLTSFTNDEETAAGFDKRMPFLLETRLRELGANFVGKPNWSNHVEADGKLVTGQNPQSSRDTALAVIELLNSPS